jgi:hypothetical protein
MMTTYPIRPRGLVWGQWILGTIFMGAIFAMTALPVVTGDAPAAERPARIGVFAVFVLIGFGSFAWERRQFSEIRVTHDGAIEVVRANGQVTLIPARDVHDLEGAYIRDYDGNLTVWSFSLQTGADTFMFGEFPGVMDFVEQVRFHHPGVRITGLWPMGPP